MESRKRRPEPPPVDEFAYYDEVESMVYCATGDMSPDEALVHNMHRIVESFMRSVIGQMSAAAEARGDERLAPAHLLYAFRRNAGLIRRMVRYCRSKDDFRRCQQMGAQAAEPADADEEADGGASPLLVLPLRCGASRGRRITPVRACAEGGAAALATPAAEPLPHGADSKSVKVLRAALAEFDTTGEVARIAFDPAPSASDTVRTRRMLRANRIASTLTKEDYQVFFEARRASFVRKNDVGGPITKKFNDCFLRGGGRRADTFTTVLLGYVANECVASLLDACIRLALPPHVDEPVDAADQINYGAAASDIPPVIRLDERTLDEAFRRLHQSTAAPLAVRLPRFVDLLL